MESDVPGLGIYSAEKRERESKREREGLRAVVKNRVRYVRINHLCGAQRHYI